MKYELKKVVNPKEIFDYMKLLPFPYNYDAEYTAWEKSYLYDIDGEGRLLFSDLTTIGAYLGSQLAGFIQYGRTALGFDENGEISDTISYSVIRNFYFDETQKEAGNILLNEAFNDLWNATGRIYAFFHYFGMSCYARHGKLFEEFGYIHNLLQQNGFVIEHENVFYSSKSDSPRPTKINVNWHNETLGRQQYGDFILEKEIVGGCEIHFPEQESIAYLRWIFINEGMRGNGIGSECMSALKTDLWNKGIMKLDTDTALSNKTAQHFYEKNHFVKEGITRSYYLEAWGNRV